MDRQNVAHASGGAITVQGPALSTLRVEQSVFDTNAVRVSTDGSGVDVTVRLNTVKKRFLDFVVNGP